MKKYCIMMCATTEFSLRNTYKNCVLCKIFVFVFVVLRLLLLFWLLLFLLLFMVLLSMGERFGETIRKRKQKVFFSYTHFTPPPLIFFSHLSSVPQLSFSLTSTST